MPTLERNQKREERFQKLLLQSLNGRKRREINTIKIEQKKPKHNPKNLILDNIIKVDDCWIWNRSSTSNNYGKVHYNNKAWRAHRLSYTLFKGEIEGNQFVCHKCDNTRCVNPDHLFLGSAADNMQDCVSKGRYKNAKKVKPVICDDVKLRALIFIATNKKMSVAKVSKELGIDIQIIKELKNGIKYAHLIKNFL